VVAEDGALRGDEASPISVLRTVSVRCSLRSSGHTSGCSLATSTGKVSAVMSLSGTTPAYSGIGLLDEVYLSEALSSAPSYSTKVANAIGRTIRCIHGLEALHRTAMREQLEVYIGRASESTLAQRWKSHHKARGHNYGAVVFTCERDKAEVLEDIAIKALKKLRERDALCVGSANVWNGNAGKPPRRDEVAVIYMTWKISESVLWTKPTLGEIREVAHEVATETLYPVAAVQVERGLGTLKRLSESDKLKWWTP
jgi:hypothetical protein